MCSAEPDDPQDAEVAMMYKQNRDLFNQTAKYWKDTFALESASPDLNDKIKRVADLGFSAEKARIALEKHNWDETEAINELLS